MGKKGHTRVWQENGGNHWPDQIPKTVRNKLTHWSLSPKQDINKNFWVAQSKWGKNGQIVGLDHLRGPAAGSHWCEPPWTHGARRPSRRREEGEGGREERGRRGGRDTGRGRLTAEQPTGLYDRTEGGGGAARCRPHSHQNVLVCPKSNLETKCSWHVRPIY